MSELDTPGQKLLALLVATLQLPSPFITYGAALKALELPNDRPTAGQSLEAHGLGSLANWLYSKGYPGITGIVVDGTTLRPGTGFFALFRKKKDDDAWWLAAIEDAKSFDWVPFLGGLLATTPKASDLDEPPKRVQATVYRILRDTATAVRVKRLHDHSCQICGDTVTLANGQRYSEAHHIQPLGHGGPDHDGNIMCVCPNHHVQLDYAALPLVLGTLQPVRGHQVGEKFVAYHNELHRRAAAGKSIAYSPSAAE